MNWRDRFRPAIAQILEAYAGDGLPAIRAALREAGPSHRFGAYPYQVWCDEVRRQLGHKRELYAARHAVDMPGQGKLFE